MNNVNDIEKKNNLTETQRRNKKNKYQRERYKRTIRINPIKIRSNTKDKRKKEIINKRQALLQTQQASNKNKSKEKIQGQNEK